MKVDRERVHGKKRPNKCEQIPNGKLHFLCSDNMHEELVLYVACACGLNRVVLRDRQQISPIALGKFERII